MDPPLTVWHSNKVTSSGIILKMVQKMLILASVKFKPASTIHSWIEKGLLYTKTCQAFRFDQYCSCYKAILAGGAQFFD